ncbi:MAG: LysM peptidoglycan-binding domain-containing M23 family metallopeptidase [Chloroflexota bacterium]|nr:LysM peptidoglycan-binding domain-containing M23 family metallopeptidase [Chloroflexota bacterium]
MPNSESTNLLRSDKQKTEIAGILNPVELQTQQVSPAPTTLYPTQATPTSEIENKPLNLLAGEMIYTIQQGDILPALAARFDVPVESIRANVTISTDELLPIGLQLAIPDLLEETLPYQLPILPDSEVVYGPSVGDFDAAEFARQADGFLASYSEEVKGEVLSGPDIVQIVSLESSTNPRLLLAFLEYRSGWVLGHPPGAEKDKFPIGYGASDTGLYNELMITAKLLAQGFYGWRDGSLLELTFYGGSSGRLSPGLNAGSVALMHLFSMISSPEVWETQLFGENTFQSFYTEVFGDFLERADSVEPYLLSTVEQPDMVLPFQPGERWSLTGGPHITWQTGTPRGALDFAPITGEPNCTVSKWWTTAAASGLVVRSNRSVVAIDLDGDGDEGTGWVLIYQHISEKDRVTEGTWLDQDDPIGHPSCEGGHSTGTHVHFTRKYNGEWVGVGEPFSLVLSGWRAYAGEGRYQGFLQKGDEIVNAQPNGASGSTIIRDD